MSTKTRPYYKLKGFTEVITFACFQASAANYMSTKFFSVIKQRVVAISLRRSGRTWSRNVSKKFWKISLNRTSTTSFHTFTTSLHRVIRTHDAIPSFRSFQFVAKETKLRSATQILGRRSSEWKMPAARPAGTKPRT